MESGGSWRCSDEDIPPADWAGCQKILLVVHNIEEGDLVKFSVTRVSVASSYRDVKDCGDGTTMTQAYGTDVKTSGELGPEESFDVYYYYYTS